MSPLTPSTGRSGRTKPKPWALMSMPSDHEVHAVGQPEVAAAGGDDRAGRDEVLEAAAERRPVLARDLEPLGELRQGGGMVDLLADAGQDLVV